MLVFTSFHSLKLESCKNNPVRTSSNSYISTWNDWAHRKTNWGFKEDKNHLSCQYHLCFRLQEEFNFTGPFPSITEMVLGFKRVLIYSSEASVSELFTQNLPLVMKLIVMKGRKHSVLSQSTMLLLLLRYFSPAITDVWESCVKPNCARSATLV